MTRRMYVIRLPLLGTEHTYDLCKCDDPAAVGNLVAAILLANKGEPITLTVITMLVEEAR